MKSYKRIITVDGKSIPHTSIKGLKLAIKHKKLPDGEYIGLTKSGMAHTWKIISKPYVLKGKRNSSKGTTGKGITVLNPKAELV